MAVEASAMSGMVWGLILAPSCMHDEAGGKMHDERLPAC